MQSKFWKNSVITSNRRNARGVPDTSTTSARKQKEREWMFKTTPSFASWTQR